MAEDCVIEVGHRDARSPPCRWRRRRSRPRCGSARCFHAHYERLAPDFGYATRPDSAKPWADVPERNRRLMVATVGHVLRDLNDAERLWRDVEGGADRPTGADAPKQS